ncbi:hypothetical protein AGMMS49938_03020 [Fibrobacterales bacterium]|nr:hypothetical protein AGMMS49938_03020 [Fibrobacterales bacterium]
MKRETAISKEKRIGKDAEGDNAKYSNNAEFYEPLVCTSVQVFTVKGTEGKTKAFAKIVLNGQIMLTGLRVVLGTNGYFVAYPNDPYFKGEEFHSIYYPIEKKFRDHVEQCVLEKYQELFGGTAD